MKIVRNAVNGLLRDAKPGQVVTVTDGCWAAIVTDGKNTNGLGGSGVATVELATGREIIVACNAPCTIHADAEVHIK